MARLGVPRLLITIAVGVALLAAAVPVVAFGIVPLLVRSTVHEAAPTPLPRPSYVPAAEATPGPFAGTTDTIIASGMLRRLSAVHYGSGLVSILDLAGTRYLRFENVAIAGAPNMYVYLSDRGDGRPGRFTDLGALKATDGSFNYPLPDGLDLAAVHSVVVWCRAFSVTVTFAELARG